MTTATERRAIAACSFCLKPDTEVEKLVAGPGVYICNECVDLCVQLIAVQPDASKAAAEPTAEPTTESGAAEPSATQSSAAEPAADPEGAPPPQVDPWERIKDVEMALDLLPRMAAVSGQLEENLTHVVRRARALGATWARIGEALGMTRQSAWERFSGEE